MKKLVKIEIKERNPFGETLDETHVNNPGRTRTFIPGYSDEKVRREQAENSRPLAHRLHSVRVERNGVADGSSVARWKAKGYTMPTWEELKAAGYDMENSAYQRTVDGYAKLGDVQVMWAPAKVAAAHYKRQREETKALNNIFEQKFEEAVDSANKEMGYKKGSRGATKSHFEIEGGKS